MAAVATARPHKAVGEDAAFEKGNDLVFDKLRQARVWLVEAGINMFIGVVRAGYSISAETPMFALVFGVPAVASLVVWWVLR